MPRGYQFAVITSQWPVIDRELHRDRRRINRHKRQRLPLGVISYGFSNKNILKAGKPNNISGVCLRNLNPLHPFEMINCSYFGRFLPTIAMDANRRIAHLYFAANNLAERNTSE